MEAEMSDDLVKRLRPLSWSDIDARFGVPMDETMREAADRIEALTAELTLAEQRGYANAMEAERKLHEDRIQTLTEQLEAARADAKEAEAYAEGLERDLKTCRMAQTVMDNTVAELERERDELRRCLQS